MYHDNDHDNGYCYSQEDTKLDKISRLVARGKRDMNALNRLACDYNLGTGFDAELASRNIEDHTVHVIANQIKLDNGVVIIDADQIKSYDQIKS